jgi:hypothetical protein
VPNEAFEGAGHIKPWQATPRERDASPPLRRTWIAVDQLIADLIIISSQGTLHANAEGPAGIARGAFRVSACCGSARHACLG